MQKLELQNECKRVWLEVKRVHIDLGRLNISQKTVTGIKQELDRTYRETDRLTNRISKLYTEID